jgi:transposase
MSSDGVEAYELSVGSTNSSTSFDFVRGSLNPTMQPFPDRRSIIVMDNRSIHHVQEIKDFIESLGIVQSRLQPHRGTV